MPITFVIVEDYLFHSKFHFTGFDVVWHQTPPAGGHAFDWWILHVPTPK
jgi:hypothetical protein